MTLPGQHNQLYKACKLFLLRKKGNTLWQWTKLSSLLILLILFIEKLPARHRNNSYLQARLVDLGFSSKAPNGPGARAFGSQVLRKRWIFVAWNSLECHYKAIVFCLKATITRSWPVMSVKLGSISASSQKTKEQPPQMKRQRFLFSSVLLAGATWEDEKTSSKSMWVARRAVENQDLRYTIKRK